MSSTSPPPDDLPEALGWPLPDEEVREALLAAYADGSWGRYHGPHVARLEAALASLHGVAHALTCASGTIAVELALRGAGVSAGQEVILAGYDFPGNFRSIEAIGAHPVLVDIEPSTWCLDPERLDEALSRTTRAVLVSHLHGGLAAMPAIRAWADQRNLAVVEDACQAPGAMVAGRAAGTWGDVGVLSFGGSKLLTAGRGGAVLTHHADIHQRMKIWADRGNLAFPLSELQAAVLLPQLRKLTRRNEQRRQTAARIATASAQWPLLKPLNPVAERGAASFYKFAWLADSAESPCVDREALLAAFQHAGLPLDAGFRGFAGRSSRRCRRPGDLPHARRAARDTVLLHHPLLLATPATLELFLAKMAQLLQDLLAKHRSAPP